MQNQSDIEKYIFESGKTFTHGQGLSCCFRQWRADSHCRFLHGYALQVSLTFRSNRLDHRNWVIDFGGLKEVRQWLADTFDHKTIIAKDDPELEIFKALAITSDSDVGTIPSLQDATAKDRIIDLVVVDDVGCEAFAKMIFEYVQQWLTDQNFEHPVFLQEVEVREHESNFARYRRNS